MQPSRQCCNHAYLPTMVMVDKDLVAKRLCGVHRNQLRRQGRVRLLAEGKR